MSRSTLPAIKASIHDEAEAIRVLGVAKRLVHQCVQEGLSPRDSPDLIVMHTMFKQCWPTLAVSYVLCLQDCGYELTLDEEEQLATYAHATDFISQLGEQSLPAPTPKQSIWDRWYNWFFGA